MPTATARWSQTVTDGINSPDLGAVSIIEIGQHFIKDRNTWGGYFRPFHPLNKIWVQKSSQ